MAPFVNMATPDGEFVTETYLNWASFVSQIPNLIITLDEHDMCSLSARTKTLSNLGIKLIT